MLTLLVLALGFCLIAAFLCAVAIGIGFLLSACVPSLQLGHGIIAGAIVAVATLYFLRRLLNAASNYTDDDEGLPDDHPVIVLPKDFLHRGPRRSKPKGKSK